MLEAPPLQTHCTGCEKPLKDFKLGEFAFCSGGCKEFLPTMKRLKREWREAGLCYGCGRAPEEGYKGCIRCREKAREKAQRRRASKTARRAAAKPRKVAPVPARKARKQARPCGFRRPERLYCPGCGGALLGRGPWHCNDYRCREVFDTLTELRRRWKTAGLCYGCGDEPQPRYKSCWSCRTYGRRRRRYLRFRKSYGWPS